MFISKDITVGQAAVLATLMRSIPSSFYVEGGFLKCAHEQNHHRSLMEVFGRGLGIRKEDESEEEVENVTSVALPEEPTALWRVMRMADRRVGRLETPIVRAARRIMACEGIAISKEGLWVYGNVVTTWGPGKNQLDKYEKDSVAAAMVGRSEGFAVQVYRMIDADILVQADMDEDCPCINVNPDLIEWLREWVPGGYTLLKTALTGESGKVRVAAIEEILNAAVGPSLDDSGDFEPDEVLSSLIGLVSAGNYAPFCIDDEGWIDFTVGNANTDLAEHSECSCGKCTPDVVTTHGYRGQVNVVAELGTFSTPPKTMLQYTKSVERLRAFLSHNRNTPYDVVAAGITDETINGWTELNLSLADHCETVQ